MAIPIPKRVSGFTLGDSSADVQIEIFFDIQCPHSKRLWPNVLAVLENYQGKSVSVTAQLITLSNHRQAWDISLGLHAVAASDPQTFFDFTRFLFDRQAEFLNAPFRHKTHEDLRQCVADFAHEFCAFDKAKLLTLLDEHDVYIAARTPIRYAATRAIWATPTILINNADDVPLAFDSSAGEWFKVIDELLG